MSSKDGIFVRHHVDYRAQGHITHLKVQNNNLIVVLNGRRVEHIRQSASHNNESSIINVQLNGEDRIAHVHLDFSGTHAIISTTAGDNFYLCTKSLAVKPLKRFKSMTISAVAWSVDFPKDGSTGFIVLGTTKGVLFEACITPSGALTYFKNWENVFSGTEKLLAITGLHFYQCSDDENKYFLLICMPGRLYALCESPNFGTLTQPLVNHPPVVGTVWSGVMVEQPSSAVLQAFFGFSKSKTPRYHCQSDGKLLMPSMLAVHPAAMPNEPPTKYCWTTGEGIAVGRVEIVRRGRSSAGASDASATVSSDAYEIFEQEAILKHKRVEGRFDFPLDVVLTEHHLLALYSGRVAAISLLNQTVAFEENFSVQKSKQKVELKSLIKI